MWPPANPKAFQRTHSAQTWSYSECKMMRMHQEVKSAAAFSRPQKECCIVKPSRSASAHTLCNTTKYQLTPKTSLPSAKGQLWDLIASVLSAPSRKANAVTNAVARIYPTWIYTSIQKAAKKKELLSAVIHRAGSELLDVIKEQDFMRQKWQEQFNTNGYSSTHILFYFPRSKENTHRGRPTLSLHKTVSANSKSTNEGLKHCNLWGTWKRKG